MSAACTLTALGAALGEQVPPLARVAKGKLSAAVASEDALHPLETLLDRLCLSLTLAKPVGLAAWAERESPRIGRAGILDMMRAASETVAYAANGFGAKQRRLGAFLDVLKREVEVAVLDVRPEEPQSDDGSAALLALLAERDSGTCCHSKATAQWSKRLAIALDCDLKTSEFIALCALLHDVGKIVTPDSVLLKTGTLTPPEWEVMRDHSAAGARILNQVPSLQRCAMIVRAHHERFDRTGYQDRLAGASIPFEARVVVVADAFHAMISDRPYRLAIAPRQALGILQEGRGTQWDPDVVDAMLSMFSRRTSIPSHAEQASSA